MVISARSYCSSSKSSHNTLASTVLPSQTKKQLSCLNSWKGDDSKLSWQKKEIYFNWKHNYGAKLWFEEIPAKISDEKSSLISQQSTVCHPPIGVSVNLCCTQTNLVAFLCLVIPVGVWEMDVASRLLHHPFDVVATFANNVGVLRVGNIHLQSYPVALKERKRGGQGGVMNKIPFQ